LLRDLTLALFAALKAKGSKIKNAKKYLGPGKN
jgi:hypothetical protein